MRPVHQIVLGISLLAAGPILFLLPSLAMFLIHFGSGRGWFPPNTADFLETKGMAVVIMILVPLLTANLIIAGLAYLVTGIVRHARRPRGAVGKRGL